jgi:hypothetical protein
MARSEVVVAEPKSPLFAPVDAVGVMNASAEGCLSRQEDCRLFA